MGFIFYIMAGGSFQSWGRRIARVVEKNFEEQVAFLGKLVRARSSNPASPDESSAKTPIEKEVAELIYQKLVKVGLKPVRIGVSNSRQNVVGYFGDQKRKSLILNGHMDTVPPVEDYSLSPFSGTVRRDRLYGVGALDMKGSLSAYVYAVKALKDIGVSLSGRVILEFVVDEESGACSKWGTSYLLGRGITAKAAIIAEPSGDGDKIGIGHRGGYRFKLKTKGEGIHTGVKAWERKEAGRNAIVDMALVVEKLANLEIPFKPARAFPGRMPVLTFPTKISGGVSINMVPDRCVAYGDVRLMPGNSDTQVRLWIQEKLGGLGIDYEIEDLLFVPSMEIDPKEEIVSKMAVQVEAVAKIKPRLEGIGPWNDAWMLIKRDIPTVCQVPLIGGGAHGADEWVDLKSLRQLTEVLARVMVDYLGVN
ncbi:MAG: M20 family metallopeptidase [Candidatus Chisholmbacteria bacterium]|nr:M20 family metallopeptidase [Candidatus Chisholmbacteria bacterium]